MRTADEERFREFARGQALAMRRCAFLLCGDWHFAEDLVQTALAKIYRAWPRIRSTDTLDHYVRTVLLRCWLDEKRRPRWRMEHRGGVIPDHPDPAAEFDPNRDWTRTAVLAALQEISPKQRAVLVLRYFEELSIAETAGALGCTEGTVKSHASRGLAALRAVIDRQDGELAGTADGRNAS